MTDKTQTPLERAARAVELELSKQEMVLTDPLTLRRMMAERCVRAVLLAIREPSEAMVEVGGEKVFSGSRSAAQVGVKNAWQAMIDVALGE